MLIRRKTMMSVVMHDINVIQTHTNLVSSRIVRYKPYMASVVCDTDCEVYLMTIKMGGVDITSTAWDSTTNVISITSITDDVDIECYAMHSMPSDYIRVDGIKNPSNAFLRTSYTVSYNNKLFIKTSILPKSSEFRFIASSKSPSAGGVIGSGWYIHTNDNIAILDGTTARTLFTATARAGEIWEFTADYKKATYSYGSTTLQMPSRDNTDTYPFCLFGRNDGANSSSTAGQIIYYFHIYDYSTTSYVRYYIPCLNASGVAGFWDAARGVFQGSSNSTAFEAYPYDSEVEYLESDGLAYINTGVVLTKNYEAEFDITPIRKTDTYAFVLGAFTSNSWTTALAYNANGNAYTQIGATWVDFTDKDYVDGIRRTYVCRADGSNQYLSDGTNSGNNTITGYLSSLPSFLLARNADGVADRPIVAKLWSAKIKINGVLTRDYIPVRKGGIGYLYDKVSGQLFGNANSSGAFTYGADK